MSQQKPNTKIIWFALFMSQIIYLIIPNVISISEEPPEDILLMALGAVGVSNVVMAFVLPILMKKVDDFALKIIQFAILESCSIIGFVGVVIGGPALFQYSLALLAMGGMIVAFPKEKIKGRIEEGD